MGSKLNPVFVEPSALKQKRIKYSLIEQNAPKGPSTWLFLISLFIIISVPFGLLYTLMLLNRFMLSRFNLNLFSSTSLIANILGAQSQINPLKRDQYNRTNILVIGVDRGEGRFTTFNTDAIMTLTYDHNTHRLITVSYPRDLFVKIPKTARNYDKINAVYLYGERLQKDGIGYLEEVIKRISGLEIHYYVMIDFDGFKRLIDELGGITINNPRGFVDYNYPRPGGGYMTVRFEKGILHLDGERALQYARSRKALGPEGSDFARAKRQQRVLQAVFNEIAKKVKENPLFLNTLFTTLQHTFKYSPITWEEFLYAIKLYQQKGSPRIYGIVLEPTVANLRLLKSYAIPLYIIIPRHGLGEWYFTQLFIRDLINYPEFITNLPSKAYLVRCGQYQDFLNEKKLLTYRLFYLPMKESSQIHLCEMATANTILLPENLHKTKEDIRNLTGYDVIISAEVEAPYFLIFEKSNITKHY